MKTRTRDKKFQGIRKWDAIEIEWVDALHTIIEGWMENSDVDYEDLRRQSKAMITRGTFLNQDDLNIYVGQTHNTINKAVLGGMAIPKGTVLAIKKLISK